MLDLNCEVQRGRDVVAVEADRDLVLVSITNGCYYDACDVAGDMWEAI